MMKLSETFLNLYDKAGRLHALSNGSFVINEANPNADLKQLTVKASGSFVCFGEALVKGRGDFPKRTTKISGNDCDGVAFYVDDSNSEHLLFADLKSTLRAATLSKALKQTAMSFLKLYSWLSLCDNGTLKIVPVHFIVACSSLLPLTQEEKDWIDSQADELEQSDSQRTEVHFYGLLEKHGVAEIELGLLSCVKDKGFSKDLCERTIRVHLVDSNKSSTALLNI